MQLISGVLMGGILRSAFRFELIFLGISDSVLSVTVMICDFVGNFSLQFAMKSRQRRLDSRFLRPTLSFKKLPDNASDRALN